MEIPVLVGSAHNCHSGECLASVTWTNKDYTAPMLHLLEYSWQQTMMGILMNFPPRNEHLSRAVLSPYNNISLYGLTRMVHVCMADRRAEGRMVNITSDICRCGQSCIWNMWWKAGKMVINFTSNACRCVQIFSYLKHLVKQTEGW